MKNSKTSERIWWMVIIDADFRCHVAFKRGDEEDAKHWLTISNRARTELRDTYKINLDRVGDSARELMDDLFDLELEKQEKEEALMTKFEQTLAQAQRSIAKIGKDNSPK